MPEMTRRKMIKSTALTALATQVACTQEECKNFQELVSGMLLSASAETSSLRLSIEWLKGLHGERQTIPVTLPNTSSLVNSAAGGPTPPASSNSKSPTRASHGPGARSFYLLDQLGDDRSDGRILAVDADQIHAVFRGEVSLRPAMPGAPGPQFRDITLSGDGRLIVVAQAGEPAQWILVDTASLTILGRLLLDPGMFPRRSVVSPDGRLAYGVVSNSPSDGSQQQLGVQIIDTSTRTVVGTIPLPAATTIVGLTITPDGGLLYGTGVRFLHVIDLATGTYSGRFDVVPPAGDARPFTGNVERLVMHPSGERMFATLTRAASGETSRSAFVAVLDARSAQKTAEWPLLYPSGVFESRISITPDGQLLAAGFQLGPAMQIFDTSLGEEAFRIPLDASFRFSTLAMA